MRKAALSLAVLVVAVACGVPSVAPPRAPVTGHPRLWITDADVARLRTWVSADNPLWADGLKLLARTAREDMDAGRVPGEDNGGDTYSPYATETYAELFAFLSLVHPNAGTRADYAGRARTLLMAVIDEAAKGAAPEEPFRDPDFATSDRSRWNGEGFALTVDWIYDSLTSADKATIREVFLRWADEIVSTGYHHPEPVGVTNDPVLLEDPIDVRWSANNYFTAGARNIGMMAMAFDAADDPGGDLRDYLGNATGAWLYTADVLLRGDSAGGLAAEGFEYSPQSMGYLAQLLLALRTAGQDDPDVWGPQVVLRDNPFWNDVVPALLHSLSPKPVPHAYYDAGQYLPAWYGDGQLYAAPDFIEMLGPLALHAASAGPASRVEQIRWIETYMAPGGEPELDDRIRSANDFTNAILAFMLFDPEAPPSDDPRPDLPLRHVAPGLGRILARSSWNPGARWFTYTLSWNSIDHQHSDAGSFELWRKGEWLTKERTGYGANIACSDYHNTLAIENDEPEHSDPTDYRGITWRRGSQYAYVPAGDPTLLARSLRKRYVYALADMTPLYNSDYEGVDDVTHASRSIVWLKPDRIVVYDRAETGTAGRFKRFWLQFPREATIAGDRATMISERGQRLYVTALLPADAELSVTEVEPLEEEGEPADDDPIRYRFLSEVLGGPRSARFLTVVEGTDAGETAAETAVVRSDEGAFEGARVGTTVVMFPVTVGADDSLAYTAPTGTTRHLVTGLEPGGSYAVTLDGTRVTIAPGTGSTADAGGVLKITA